MIHTNAPDVITKLKEKTECILIYIVNRTHAQAQ